MDIFNSFNEIGLSAVITPAKPIAYSECGVVSETVFTFRHTDSAAVT